MEKYVHGEAISEEELRAAIRRATIAMKAFPVLCGSAFKNKGVQPLLDAVVDYLPSPLDIPPIEGSDPDDEEKTLIRKADDTSLSRRLIFKIMTDPYVGQLAFLRVYSGTFGKGTRSTIRAATGANAFRGCCKCTPTSAKRSRRSLRAISPRPWV